MPKITKWTLFILDSIIIGLLGLFLVFRSSYQPKPVFDLSLAILPFLISWLILGTIKNTFDLELSFQIYLKRTALAWLVSGIGGQIVRFVLNLLVTQAYFTFEGLLIDLVLFSILFLSWRVLIKLIFQLSAKSGNTHRAFISLVTALGLLALILSTPYIFIRFRYRQSLFSTLDTPSVETGLVFGAGVYGNQIPSAILRSRLDTAADLYHQGKIHKIILSGNTDEVEVMLKISLGLHVPEVDLISDDQGSSTYDSCSNAKQLDIEQPVILISQKYHLYRALFSCHSAGIESYGVQTGQNSAILEYTLKRNLREIPATAWTCLKVIMAMVLST